MGISYRDVSNENQILDIYQGLDTNAKKVLKQSLENEYDVWIIDALVQTGKSYLHTKKYLEDIINQYNFKVKLKFGVLHYQRFVKSNNMPWRKQYAGKPDSYAKKVVSENVTYTKYFWE